MRQISLFFISHGWQPCSLEYVSHYVLILVLVIEGEQYMENGTKVCH